MQFTALDLALHKENKEDLKNKTYWKNVPSRYV